MLRPLLNETAIVIVVFLIQTVAVILRLALSSALRRASFVTLTLLQSEKATAILVLPLRTVAAIRTQAPMSVLRAASSAA
jgi:hypothetical protein